MAGSEGVANLESTVDPTMESPFSLWREVPVATPAGVAPLQFSLADDEEALRSRLTSFAQSHGIGLVEGSTSMGSRTESEASGSQLIEEVANLRGLYRERIPPRGALL